MDQARTTASAHDAEERTMTVTLNPYIGFRTQARDALGFYHSVFGGEATLTTFGEAGMAQDPADADKLMHGQLLGENGLVLMVSDAPAGMEGPDVSNISVSLSGDDEEGLTRYWNGLAEGATIIEPLTKAPWGDVFGMLTDRFGVAWLVNISGSADSGPAGSAPDVSGAAD